MPYDVKRFIFSVSLCAMLVANPVLATTPTNDEDLGTTHDVYVESTLNQATNGIAGVSYVNRMVNAAGNAAELAEGHAAAAGAHALSAAQSADEAHEVLDEKLDKSGWPSGMAMVTNDAGSVYAGYVAPSMIADGGKIDNAVQYSGFVLWSDHDGNVSWKTVDDKVLANGAVTVDKIADNAVSAHKIAGGAVTADKIQGVYSESYTGMALIAKDDKGNVEWGKVGTLGLADGAVTIDKIGHSSLVEDNQTVLVNSSGGVSWQKIADYNIRDGAVTASKIADGAVTIDKTDGVVGMVPVGSADATTYGQFWIE